MIGLITGEELDALLSTPAALVDQAAQKYFNKGNKQVIPSRTRLSFTASPVSHLLRNMISAEEIAAILAFFPRDDKRKDAISGPAFLVSWRESHRNRRASG
jgi:hypothetical protein